jgi:hypothetical protein
MNPTGADPLATLVQRYRSEFEAWDSEAPDADAVAAWTWARTLRLLERTPALTKTDALAALDLIEEELDITANLEEPFPSLIAALRGYINGTQFRGQRAEPTKSPGGERGAS